MNSHQGQYRPPAQVLEDLAATVLAIGAHPCEGAPSDQLLAAAVFAERVSQTLTWQAVCPDLLRETGDVATGRVLLATLNPTREIGHRRHVLQLKAARLIVTAAMDSLDGRDSLLPAANALGEALASIAAWEPNRPSRWTPEYRSEVA